MVSHHVWWTGLASRAHLIYGASWLRQLDGDVSVSLFPFRTFLDAPELTLDDVREAVPDRVAVESWDPAAPVPAADRRALLSVGAVGIKPWLQLRRKLGTARLPVVITDEGFGSYGDWSSRRDAWARQGVKEPWRSVRTAAVTTASALLTSRRWLLYRQVRRDWRLNPPVAEEFRRYARRSHADGGAVFLTQPWPELGVMSEQRYLAHIREVADACADAGLRFTIHPHPAERPERYEDWAVHRLQELAELDEQSVNATVLLGATSTAMLNVAAIHGVPAMRVGFPELPGLEQTHSNRQQSLLEHYLGEVVPTQGWRDKLTELGSARAAE